MRYTPFDKELADIMPDDLAILRDVHEGWYVEYKSEMINNRALAKSLSSFANQYGGWLFLGVSEDRKTNTAQRFPGIPANEVNGARESLRNATKDLLQPEVFYDIREFAGPIASMGLGRGQSVIVVRIPEGPNPPYVHTDGRVYRRIGDSSDPKPVNDRGSLDLLAQRGARARSLLEERILRTPIVSKSESTQPYIHFKIFSDRYETLGHSYRRGFSEFSEIMKGGWLPFDNIFPSSDGFVARQVKDTDFSMRCLTWELSRHLHSFVTLPMTVMLRDVPNQCTDRYSNWQEFLEILEESERDGVRANVLDLNHVLTESMVMIMRHRRLASQANVTGPFYIKVHLENVWRTVPFVNGAGFLDQISQYGPPLVQEEEIFIPGGTSPDKFAVLDERDAPESESSIDEEAFKRAAVDMAAIGGHIFSAFGIRFNANDVTKLLISNVNIRTNRG